VITYDSTSRIDRPAGEIFERLADAEGMDDWTDMTDSRWVGDERGEGARARATLRLGPFRRPLEWTVTAFEPGRRIAFTTTPGGPIDWTAEYSLEGDATGTTVRQVGSVQPHGMLRLLEPLIRMELPKGESRELDRLRQVLERRHARATTP
jgi:hypothetical protein